MPRLIASACLLLSAAVSSAGPLPWSYTATLAGDRGSAYISDGYGSRPSSEGPIEYQGYTQLHPAANAGVQSGSALLTLGRVDSGDFYWREGEPPAFTVDPNYVIGLTIRDELSGASGTVSVTGYAVSRDSWLGAPADLNLPEQGGGWWNPGQEVSAGGQRFRVRFWERKVNPRDGGPFTGQLWDSLEVVAEVQVLDPPAVPEPGTLALGGVALTGGLVAWRRKRLANAG